MASTTARLGMNAKTYRNTNTYASPTWDLVDNIRDLNMPLESDEVDSSIRGFGGFASSEPTLMRIGLSFNMNHDPDDTDWEALRASYFDRSAVELLILDRATGTGAEGIRASFKVHQFSKGEPLAGLQTTDVVAKPCIAANAPAWYTGA